MLTPERRAELRQTLHYNGQPNFAVGRDIIAALVLALTLATIAGLAALALHPALYPNPATDYPEGIS